MPGIHLWHKLFQYIFDCAQHLGMKSSYWSAPIERGKDVHHIITFLLIYVSRYVKQWIFMITETKLLPLFNFVSFCTLSAYFCNLLQSSAPCSHLTITHVHIHPRHTATSHSHTHNLTASHTHTQHSTTHVHTRHSPSPTHPTHTLPTS